MMAIDFSTQVYSPAFDIFSRPITVTPLKSQPSQPAYTGRGIYGTQALDVAAEDASIFSDQITILDIIEREFLVVPIQGDRVFIPAHLALPEIGNFEIVDSSDNGGGQTTFNIRKLVVSKP